MTDAPKKQDRLSEGSLRALRQSLNLDREGKHRSAGNEITSNHELRSLSERIYQIVEMAADLQEKGLPSEVTDTIVVAGLAKIRDLQLNEKSDRMPGALAIIADKKRSVLDQVLTDFGAPPAEATQKMGGHIR